MEKIDPTVSQSEVLDLHVHVCGGCESDAADNSSFILQFKSGVITFLLWVSPQPPPITPPPEPCDLPAPAPPPEPRDLPEAEPPPDPPWLFHRLLRCGTRRGLPFEFAFTGRFGCVGWFLAWLAFAWLAMCAVCALCMISVGVRQSWRSEPSKPSQLCNSLLQTSSHSSSP